MNETDVEWAESYQREPSGRVAQEGGSADSASSASSAGALEVWPSLPYEEWRETYETLHMWTQVVGKIRLTLSPKVNHWWHAALYVTSRGPTTSPVPYCPHWSGTF